MYLPGNLYSEIHIASYFKHYTGINEDLLNFICSQVEAEIYEARKYNLIKKRRRCKTSNKNRTFNFLHQMRTGEMTWDACNHGWNTTSTSQDFFHVLYHFVKTFDSAWLCPMSYSQRAWSRGRVPESASTHQALDGAQLLTTKSKKLPVEIRRSKACCWIPIWSQAKNV